MIDNSPTIDDVRMAEAFHAAAAKDKGEDAAPAFGDVRAYARALAAYLQSLDIATVDYAENEQDETAIVSFESPALGWKDGRMQVTFLSKYQGSRAIMLSQLEPPSHMVIDWKQRDPVLVDKIVAFLKSHDQPVVERILAQPVPKRAVLETGGPGW